MTSTQKTEFLDSVGDTYYACNRCNTHFALNRDLLSKSFQGRTGRAFLFKNVSNVKLGPSESRELLTGQHVVADISCLKCGTVVGWKYIQPCTPCQNYKAKKYIIEKAFFQKHNNFPCC